VIQIIASVYFGLTGAQILALWSCGMPLFDATAHSFSTIATGGFSTRNLSIASFDSVAIELVTVLFMLLSGMHFGLLWTAIGLRRPRDLFRSSVVRLYLGGMAISTLIVALATHGPHYADFWQSIRYALFQVATIGTSTGFATADSAVWPWAAQLVLVLLTLQGACAGSTSGGIKVDRVLVSLKAFVRELRLLRHPRAILPLRIDGQHLEDSIVARALLFVVVYFGVLACSTFALTCRGVDLVTAFSGAAACMGNVGPGLGAVGSMANYGHLDGFSQWVLSITMLLGRLEIFSLILFFIPSRGRQFTTD
jgi:trk system potassium uptake protein TrkH